MACKQETREISGKQVFVRQWPASKAMEVQVQMMNALGEYAFPFINNEWNLKTISYVMTNCNLATFTQLVKDCCFASRIDGKDINAGTFDTELSGDLYTMYKVFAFVLEVNYKDFFDQGLQSVEEQA